MVTDRLTDRMGLEPILSINVNLMQTQTGIETVRVNEPLGTREKLVPKNFGTSGRYSEKKMSKENITFRFSTGYILSRKVKIHLHCCESDIGSRWVYREFNLMFTLSSDKDQ